MDFARNRFTALLAAATVAVALTACGDDDGEGVGESIQREGKEAGEKLEREGKEAGDDIRREAEDARDKAEGKADDKRNEVERKREKARDDIQQDAPNKADREIGEDDVRTKKDSDAR